MAEEVLKSILRDELSADVLIRWISEKSHESCSVGEFSHFPCTVGEFVSHFLNYIHEDAPSYEVEPPNKLTFTPRGIKNPDMDENTSFNRSTTVKRRPALFSDSKIADSHTFPVMVIKQDDSIKHCSSDFRGTIGTSTPKLMKINSDSVIDSSYASPISPLYFRNQLNTPRNRSAIHKSNEKGLCLGDFIVQKKSSSKKKVQRSLCDVTNSSSDTKKCRRINPTNLNEKRFSNGGFKESENSFNFKNDFIELPVGDLSEQRNLLAEERLRVRSNMDDLVRTTNIMKLQTFSSKIELIPVPEKVTFTHQLDLLVKIYVFLLNNSYVLNLISEVHFLISLLLSRQYISDNLSDSDSDLQIIMENPENPKDVFKTVHNCVYFAVCVLRAQSSLLKCLDRITLKLFYENERIKVFSEEFRTELLLIYNGKLEQTREFLQTVPTNIVCFVSDTDNRENFATDASFHAFRKQRDLFYDILRIWEQNHYLAGWNFGIALGGKIKTLLNLHHDPVNYRHFARLFKMQLLTASRQVSNDDAISEEQANFILTSLPNVNADKLHRLRNRLTTKQDHNEYNSTPTFTGQQEFYKDFILAAWGSHTFLRHLQDSLVSEIIHLNENTSEELSQSDENECSTLNATTRNSFFESLKLLRVLAKFLGFVESLPYKTDFKLIPGKVLKTEIETRKWLNPAFDLKRVVFEAFERRNLILTIPWVCKYLAMLDFATIRLPYYEEIIRMLFEVYRLTCARFPGQIYNRMLVMLSLGWLFELPHFPSDLYIGFCSKLKDGDIGKDSDSNLLNGRNLLNRVGANTAENRQRAPRLDELEIVDQTILYTFCPYLEGFRKLLSTNSSNTGNVVKHITPLTAVENSSDLTERKLKCQLEEAFFNCQPVSVRKTVEFISERVASSCVKHICNKIVPEFKKTSLEDAKNALQQFSATYDQNSGLENNLEYLLKNKIAVLSSVYLQNLQGICATETDKLINERVPLTINALLAVDELEQTKDTCITVTKRLCKERVQQWINSHVNIGIFNKFKTLHLDILKSMQASGNELKEKLVFQLPAGGRDVEHNLDTLNAVKILELLRNISVDLIESKPTDGLHMQELLKSIRRTVTGRCDVNNQILSVINRTLVDLILLIITHRWDYFDDNLQPFLNHWKDFVKPNEDHFRTLICPRNIMLMAQSKDASKSWSYFAKFVVRLLEEELLSCEIFEAQCVAMYQHEWDETTLRNLSTCFRNVTDGLKERRPELDRFSYLLSFVSSYCSEMEF